MVVLPVYVRVESRLLPHRSESSGSPPACREDMRGRDSEEERGSGEYYSGEEFQEEDIMLARDRYGDQNKGFHDLSQLLKQYFSGCLGRKKSQIPGSL